MGPITTDMLGKPVNEGDRLAVAFREGNQGAMRVGRVVGVGSRKEYYWKSPETGEYEEQRPTLIMQWEMASGYRYTETSWIFQDIKRFVVID